MYFVTQISLRRKLGSSEKFSSERKSKYLREKQTLVNLYSCWEGAQQGRRPQTILRAWEGNKQQQYFNAGILAQ